MIITITRVLPTRRSGEAQANADKRAHNFPPKGMQGLPRKTWSRKINDVRRRSKCESAQSRLEVRPLHSDSKGT